jgi:HSP20 family protein
MLSRYDVLRPILPVWGIPTRSGSNLHTMMNQLFSDFDRAFERAPAAKATRVAGSPRVQLRDVGEAIEMQANLPGFGMQDIELSVEDTTVTLKATAPATRVPEGFQLIRRERSRSDIEWSFELPYAIDAEGATATLMQGRLHVTLPKVPAAKPRTIAVQAG